MVEIKNLRKAAERIKKAVKDNEEIVVFSDSDLDGTASFIILEETIKSIGGKISKIYFPDRDNEGYGLNKKALEFFKRFSPALLLLLDCGISNFKEIEDAKKIGIETLIVEHHEILDKIPSAEILINPKQEGDEYPFKFFATCGLCFILAKEILGRNINKNLEKSFLELTALATIADKMPLIEDNKYFTDKGLENLPFSLRPGIRVFLKKYPLGSYSLGEIAQKISSIVQITAIKEQLTESYRLFSSKDEKEAEEILEKLEQEYAERRELIQSSYERMEEEVSFDSGNFIFWGEEGRPFFLTGALASRACSKSKKASFIFAEKDGICRGSARSPREVNSVEALKSCSDFLFSFGGHPPASGFTLKKENLDNFKKCLEKYFDKLNIET